MTKASLLRIDGIGEPTAAKIVADGITTALLKPSWSDTICGETAGKWGCLVTGKPAWDIAEILQRSI